MDGGETQPLTLTAAEIVNVSRYPVTDLSSADGAELVRKSRLEYTRTGLCMLPGFILPQAQEILAAEANSVSDKAYFCRSTHNAWLTDNVSEPADDVVHRQEATFVGSVPYDFIGEDSHLRRLYLWDPLKDFIAAVLGKDNFYRFADPLGACSINVFVEGGEHGWHFDESEYTITLMLQPPDSGGAFEYVPGIRGREDEKERVARVLDGDREGVTELRFVTGTLLIFGGSRTIHRVTKVSSRRPRLVPVFCYSEQPDKKNSETVRKLFWGRSGDDTDASL